MKVLFIITFCLVSLISLNHLFVFSKGIEFSSSLLGILGWLLLVLALLAFGRSFWRQTLIVFLLFFSFGFWRGPFLEPPADTFEHLHRIHTYSDQLSSSLIRSNMGFWHYSMAAVVINPNRKPLEPESVICRIHLAHGMFLGAVCSVLFIVARNNGFSTRWASVSCFIAFLFMGTNRFSFFSYYSLAPTFSSLMIYWLWIGAFFFRSNRRTIISGLCIAVLALPVLIVNHIQEAVFLVFVVMTWLLLNAYFSACAKGIRKKGTVLLFVISFFFLFVAPQFVVFREAIASFFQRDLWEKNQYLLFSWKDIFFMANIWKYRINDTFLHIASAIAILTVPYFWPGFIKETIERKIRIYILASLPLLGYCVPLFNFVWLSNVKGAVHYRLCYTSMFWLFFALMFQAVDKHISFKKR